MKKEINMAEKMMLVAKSNSLINASYNLELTEQRLILLAIIEARESGKGITKGEPLYIHASKYAEMYKTDMSNAYKVLKEATKTLFSRQFTYKEINKRGKVENVHTRWVNEIRYVEDEATVALEFSKSIVPFITRLEARFTKYDIHNITQFSNRYALRLYEIIIAWLENKTIPVQSVDILRGQLGVAPTEYPSVTDFKRYVLDVACEQISKYSDITVNYEQVKKGRKIDGFQFIFKSKNRRLKEVKKTAEKTVLTLTDKQRFTFAKKLSEMPEMSQYSQSTESYEQFAVRIADMLKSPENIKKFQSQLEKIGFNKA